MSVSRIWASRRSPRPVLAECFKDLLARRCPGDLPRPVFDECFKDLGLPEISAARSCKVSQGFGSPGDLRGPYLILLALRKLRPTTSIIIESSLNHD